VLQDQWWVTRSMDFGVRACRLVPPVGVARDPEAALEEDHGPGFLPEGALGIRGSMRTQGAG